MCYTKYYNEEHFVILEIAFYSVEYENVRNQVQVQIWTVEGREFALRGLWESPRTAVDTWESPVGRRARLQPTETHEVLKIKKV